MASPMSLRAPATRFQSMYFINQHQLVTVDSELEFGIGNDYTAIPRVFAGVVINCQALFFHLIGYAQSNQSDDFFHRYWQVMA